MIGAAYIYQAGDEAIVSAFEALPRDQQSSDYWSSNNLDGLRSRVKSHYINVQNFRCCYCNRLNTTKNQLVWNLDHIVCRSKYPQFMFTVTNLAASCLDCNIRKGNAETLLKKRKKNYPASSDAFKIIHPHFDNFHDHIALLAGLVYVAKTDKGKRTIYTCDLLRYSVDYIDWKRSAADFSFEADVEAIFAEKLTDLQSQVDAVAALARIVKKLKD